MGSAVLQPRDRGDESRPVLPLTDEEALLLARWLEHTDSGGVKISRYTALRLAETLYWQLAGVETIIAEPAP